MQSKTAKFFLDCHGTKVPRNDDAFGIVNGGVAAITREEQRSVAIQEKYNNYKLTAS